MVFFLFLFPHHLSIDNILLIRYLIGMRRCFFSIEEDDGGEREQERERKKKEAGDARLHTDFSFVLNVEHFLSLFIVLPFPISCNVLCVLTKDIGGNFFSFSFLSLLLS